ncbi:MAG: Ig-like domain-containing protein [Acidimicrobiales bacterium]
MSCTDPDDDPLSYSVATAPTGGAVSANGANGGFTYTPKAGFSGTDTFTVAANDGKGGVATATNTVTVKKVLVGPPTSKDQCREGTWQKFDNPTFRTQGDCVNFVTNGR